jgi:hypothetical protein
MIIRRTQQSIAPEFHYRIETIGGAIIEPQSFRTLVIRCSLQRSVLPAVLAAMEDWVIWGSVTRTYGEPAEAKALWVDVPSCNVVGSAA